MSNAFQMPLIKIDRLIKLGEVERILARVMSPVPSRPTLISYIESGVLAGKPIGLGHNYFVYESSLTIFIEQSQSALYHKLAA